MNKSDNNGGGSLGERGAKAAGIGVSGTIAKLVLQLGAQLILLRLVAPSDYGIFAISALCMSFANFLSDAGLSAALVQKKTITNEDIRCAFTLQTLLGMTISIATYLLAPTIANLFVKPELVEALRILSFVSLLNAASSVSSRLLVRDLQYFALQKASLIGYIIGYGVVGISLAATGFGYRALAFAWLCQAAVTAALTFVANPHSVVPLFDRKNVASLTGFGTKAIVTNIANWWNASVDKLMVGRFFSPTETGLYSVAYNLIYNPLMQLLSNLQSVIFAAASKVTSDEDGYRRAITGTLVLSSLIFFPIFIGLSVASEAFVGIVLGKKWLQSSPVLALLAPSFAFTAAQGLLTPYLWGKGVVEREMRIQLLVAVVALVALLALLGHGILAVAFGALLIAFLRFILVLSVVKQTFGIRWQNILSSLVPATATSFATVALGMFFRQICTVLELHFLVHLLAIAFSTTATMLISFRLYGKTIKPIISPLLGSKMTHITVRRIFG